MKTHFSRMFAIVLLLTLLVSCETLMSNTPSAEPATATGNTSILVDSPIEGDQSNPQETTSSNPLESIPSYDLKYLGTWTYSNKNFGSKMEEIYKEKVSMPVTFELTLTFHPDHTGVLSTVAFTTDDRFDEDTDVIWSGSPYGGSVFVATRDNTAEHFTMWYENEIFLSMTDKDLGTMYFAKQM
jgi:hypothetical protein